MKWDEAIDLAENIYDYNIDGKSGPKEFSVSAGFGIPLQNAYNHRSVLNISAQWAHTSADNLIRENTFRINVGLTFNERWFAKWKIDKTTNKRSRLSVS